MNYVTLITKGVQALTKSKTAVFRIKPEIVMPVEVSTLGKKGVAKIIDKEALKVVDVQGELGNIAIRQADHLKKK